MAWTQSDLDAIDNAIKAKITGGAISAYSIAGRSIQHSKLEDLIALRAQVAQIISEEASCSFILADTSQE